MYSYIIEYKKEMYSNNNQKKQRMNTKLSIIKDMLIFLRHNILYDRKSPKKFFADFIDAIIKLIDKPN